MDDEFLTSAHLRHRYKVTGKTLREWELNGTIPPADRIGTGQRARKYWRLRKIEQVERARMGAVHQPDDAA